MGKYIQIHTTTDTRQYAEAIASALVEQKLAGCVQIMGPIVSTYRWEGKVACEEEWLCSIKTSKELFADVEKTIKSIHPYDVPEIIAVPIVGGS
ncbi:MAG: divalent-cation tolerance protein CutA, partial [Deltaproteobacteria bacterium]|nr:divalent-cation tolerance protein CutA [Deltaproteobacteria bacterium]